MNFPSEQNSLKQNLLEENLKFMQIAFNFAKKHNGMTTSNPSVGCVIVKNNQIISCASTAISGRPHAESLALSKNLDFTDAILFTTLEPCSHVGKTPACVSHIIKSGIKQVFISVKDSDYRVNGLGIKMLEEAGIAVHCGLLAEEVFEFYKPYLTAKVRKKPFVTGKIACSLDGKISTFSGNSKWITSEIQRNFTNFIRHKYNGILVGGNTYKQDSPNLTCRIEGLTAFSPIKFLLSSSVKSAEGFNVVSGNLEEILAKMYSEFEINHLLIEGGAGVITEFLKQDLLDEIMLVQSPIFIGKDGKNCFEETGINLLNDVKKFTLKETFAIGGGIINILSYVRKL